MEDHQRHRCSASSCLRRVSIYMILSYAELVLVNNSGYQLENMWVLYLLLGVYIFSRWIDSKLAAKDQGN